MHTQTIARDTLSAPDPLDDLPRLSYADVHRLTGLSITTIWRAIRRGDLPPPVRISPGRVAWRPSTIRAWASRER